MLLLLLNCVRSIVNRTSAKETEIWKFEQQREFNLIEVKRLASATNMESSAIWVSFGTGKEEIIKIQGLLNTDSTWASARRAFSITFNPPPNALIIRVVGPGKLNVYQGMFLVASLASGEILERNPVTYTDYLGVYPFFTEGFNRLLLLIEDSNLTLFESEQIYYEPPQERESRIWGSYIDVFLAIVNRVQEKLHGGALIVVQNDSTIWQTTKLLKVKYLFQPLNTILRDRFVSFIQKGDVLFEFIYSNENDPGNLQDEQLTSARTAFLDSYRALMETVFFISNLSGVDGAIVITQDLQVVGFSTEIRVDEMAMNSKVYSVNDVMKNKKTLLDIEEFGMRHRSAIKLCSNTKQAFVFVISQDGDISLVWGKNNTVMVKKRLTTFSIGMILA